MPKNKRIGHAAKTQILLYFGLAGFISGVLLLFNNCFEYHEIVFHPKVIVDTLLARKQRELFPNGPNPDSVRLARSVLKKIRRNDELDTPFPDKFDKLKILLPPESTRQQLIPYVLYGRLEQERQRIEDITDTSMNSREFVGALFTYDKALLAGIYSHPDTSAISRTFCFRYDRDTTYPEYSIHAEGEITLESRTYPTTGLTFFTKYPGFGVHALLMIFQFVAFFIVIPLSLMTMLDLQIENEKPVSRFWIAIGIAFLVVVIYALAIFLRVFQPNYISDQFFMNGFTKIVGTYFVFSYLSAIACYAGFLYAGRLIGEKLVNFKVTAVRQRDNLVEQNTYTRAYAAAAAPLANNPAPDATAMSAVSALADNINKSSQAVAQTGTSIADFADDYKKLRSHFTVFFYTSAFLLSMVVLQTGSLFSAIGSLDLMRFLNAPPAYPVLRNDFVYLLGGLYSILLLIFYLPVKISMVSLEHELPDPKVVGDDKSFLPVLSSGLRTTASVLAASSPFLISIIQYILQSIGGKS